MATSYIAFIRPADRKSCRDGLATKEIKNGIASMSKFGVNISHLYWARSSYNAVLLLESEDRVDVARWRASLKYLHIRLIPAVKDMDYVNGAIADPYGSSSDMIQWWY